MGTFNHLYSTTIYSSNFKLPEINLKYFETSITHVTMDSVILTFVIPICSTTVLYDIRYHSSAMSRVGICSHENNH